MNNRFLLSLVVGLISLLLHVSAFSQNYVVMVAAYNQRVPLSHFKGLKVAEDLAYGQIYKYYLTGFADQASADKAAQEAIGLGFKDSRVENVAEKNAQCCHGYTPPARMVDELSKIRHIFFDFDKSNLTSASISQLNTLAKILRQNPTYNVDLRAYTDAKGDDNYNIALAKRRRDAAINYLVKKGISKSRVDGEFFGESQPIAKNEVNGKDSPEGRKFNRRVEIFVKDGSTILNLVEDINVPTTLKE